MPPGAGCCDWSSVEYFQLILGVLCGCLYKKKKGGVSLVRQLEVSSVL